MGDVPYRVVIAAARGGFRALGQKITITGLEHVPPTGPFLLASNHISYVDFVYAGLAGVEAGRLVRFMAKRELFRHRFTGPVMRALRHIEVDREDGLASYRTALEYFTRGEAVGIFPEATISRAMELKEFKTGAARLAAEGGVPLVPCVVWGTQRLVPKGRKRDLTRGRPISIRVGPPVPTSGHPPSDTAALKAAMTELLDQAIAAYPDREPGAWWLPAAYGGGAPTLDQAAEIEREERLRRIARRAAEGDQPQP